MSNPILAILHECGYDAQPMHDICIVTTFNRTELLYLALEAILVADKNIAVKVFSDRGEPSAPAHRQELIDICDAASAGLVFREKHDHFGNSYNLLTAMQSVLIRDNPDIVHLVEDDTIVHPTYFKWAREKLKDPAIVAVYAHLSAADTRAQWYESPCASWKAEPLKQVMLMIPDGYFADSRTRMQAALDAKFPQSRYHFGSPEQDGFFLRCIEQCGWKTAHPRRPLAAHIGAWGYNRPPNAKAPEGTLAERVQRCRELYADPLVRSAHFGERITKLELEGMAQ